MFGVLDHDFRPGRRCGIAAAVAAGFVLAGCSSSSLPSMPSLSSIMGSSSGSAANAEASAGTPPTEIECPDVTVRRGASTLSMSANPNEPSAMNLRYQVTITDTARECRLVGGIVTMRVGVQGRVIIGPAGGPGQVDIPLRLAVVHEGIEPKAITSKLQRVPVAVPGDNVTFTHVEDQVTFPMPPGAAISSYVVYVGFDPLGAREFERRRPERKPPPRQPPRRAT